MSDFWEKSDKEIDKRDYKAKDYEKQDLTRLLEISSLPNDYYPMQEKVQKKTDK